MIRTALLIASFCLTLFAIPATAQEGTPAEAFLDPGARTTFERAREARLLQSDGIHSYEARAWERVDVGLTGSRFRRERGLFRGERVARVRWEEGERVIRWEGAVQEVPVAGRRSDEDTEMANQLAEALARLTNTLSPMFYTPGYADGNDRIIFGREQWSLHPVSDTAHLHYRYRSGDTLRVTVPPDARTITIVELRIEPRRAHPSRVAGSFWFDEATGQIVRAIYRPSMPHYLAADDGDPDGTPGFLRALQAEIRQVTVDYGLHHFEWWLPYRFALDVEVRAGRLVQLPVTVEWRMDDYRVNAPRSALLDAEASPEGWTRTEIMRAAEDSSAPSDSIRLVTLVPPADSLHLSPDLTRGPDGRPLGRDPVGFSEQELGELREDLDRLLPPGIAFAPYLAWGTQAGLLRYNRVEGLSVGIGGATPLGRRLSGRGEVRIGTANHAVLGELGVQRGADDRNESVVFFRRLAHTSDWSNPLGLTASLAALVTGRDRGEYYHAHGAEFSIVRRDLPGSPEVRLFGESHRALERATDFHLFGMFGNDTLRTNLTAAEGTWFGGNLSLTGEHGRDPGAIRFFGKTQLEGAWGEGGDYQRLAASGGAARQFGPIALAFEGGVGAGWGDFPPQRQFYLGGTTTMRGVRSSSLVGASYWFSRAELARAGPGRRIAIFADWAWAGPRRDFGSGRPARSVGAGISLLDGFLRMDVARSLGPDGAWRMHFYMDGLL